MEGLEQTHSKNLKLIFFYRAQPNWNSCFFCIAHPLIDWTERNPYRFGMVCDARILAWCYLLIGLKLEYTYTMGTRLTLVSEISTSMGDEEIQYHKEFQALLHFCTRLGDWWVQIQIISSLYFSWKLIANLSLLHMRMSICLCGCIIQSITMNRCIDTILGFKTYGNMLTCYRCDPAWRN